VAEGGQGVPGPVHQVGGLVGVVDYVQHDDGQTDPGEKFLHGTPLVGGYAMLYLVKTEPRLV
jgi:hypothetical protein